MGIMDITGKYLMSLLAKLYVTIHARFLSAVKSVIVIRYQKMKRI